MTANLTAISDYVASQLEFEQLKTTEEEREQAMQVSQEMMAMQQAAAGPVDPGAPPPGAPAQ